MADFSKAFKITMTNEGGYNPGINEAETYKGIDRSINPNWGGWKLIDALKKGNASLTTAQLNTILGGNPALQVNIQNFYKVNYWDVLKLDQVKDQQVANNLFDCSVNPCMVSASHVMQQACNEVKTGALTVDGVIGSHSITCINSLSGRDVFEAVNAIREGNYRHRVESSPDKKVWLKDWLKRLIKYV